MIFEKDLYRDFDRTLLMAVVIVFIIGLFTIYSATYARVLPFSQGYVLKQMMWFAAGFFLMLAVLKISYQKFIDMAYVIYAVNLILLVFVLVAGKARLGAQRWFSVGSFAFQPSEFIKISLILALSGYVGYKKDDMEEPRSLVIPIILLAIPSVLVLAQPDLGTTLLLVPVFFSIIFVAGARIKYIIGMIAAGVASAPFFWHFLRDYQRQRLLVFIDPNIDPLGAGYNIIQSKVAIGSGGLIGKGWLNGTQNQLNFLPERHTDFIFSVIGEEWGFLGVMVLLLLYFLIIKRAFTIASSTSDLYGKSIATGIAVMISLQVIINMGMTVGLMPVVGIPLPLVSYGGSSLLSTLVAVGLLLNVGMRRSTF